MKKRLNTPKDSYYNIQNFANLIFYIIIKMYLYKILKRLSMSMLFKISLIITYISFLLYPNSKKETKGYMINTFPNFSTHKINCLVREYYANLFFHLILVTIIPYMKKEHVMKMFEINQLSIFLDENKNSKTLIIGMHFYSFMIVYLLSNICFDKNIKIIGSFAFEENDMFKNYIKRLKEKLYYDFHDPVNVSKGEGFGVIKEKIINNNITCLFSDVRFKKNKRDTTVSINNQIFNFNNGVTSFNEMYPNYKIVEFNLTFKNNKFYTEIAPIESVSNYYKEILPYRIQNNPQQWQLWFQSPIFNDLR